MLICSSSATPSKRKMRRRKMIRKLEARLIDVSNMLQILSHMLWAERTEKLAENHYKRVTNFAKE